uniref:Uncharacterized protein n=1 Tax=Fagus sylvatica TaxID=28930 RepID=A0A2N9F007_FAGSY
MSASSNDPFAYPKVKSWTLEGEGSDCCSWDGVSCDEDTGHVIGLDLSSSCLYGSINSNSSLFRLVHLQSLNLAHNHFNYSQIPSQVNIFSTVPNIFANLSTLRSLRLKYCGMHGEFPIGIFMLPNLRVLNLNFNTYLTGSWPNFRYWSSPLEEISLAATSFSGELPASMGNLRSLIYLNLCSCNFSGNIPSSIGNLTNLRCLGLEDNSLASNIPPSIGNLIQLAFVGLGSNHLTGPISFGLANMTQLVYLSLYNNRLTSSIPSSIGNLTKLNALDLSLNELQGQFPISIFNLNNLKILDIANNNLSGFLLICNMTSLQILDVSENNFSGSLSQCLHNMLELRMINLEGNQFQGLLPRSFANCTRLEAIDVSNNQFNDTFPFGLGNLPNLRLLLLRVQDFFRAIDVSSNMFVGEIPESIGDLLKGLHVLNLSNNILTGHIPPSLGNLTTLESLDLSQNRLSGEIPPQLVQLTFLEWFNVSHNNLTGSIPQGKQFDTFENSSFVGNLGLCGNPLSKKCWVSDSSPTSPLISNQSQDSTGSLFEFGWKIVLAGYGFGLLVGVIIGNIVATRKHDWLMKTFGMKQRARRNVRRE